MPKLSIRLFVLALSASLLGACSSMESVTSMINPYRIDIRQGNYVDQQMVSQLKPGMSREQVRYVLGTPLVTDLFDENRWDYVYRFQKGNGPVEQRKLSVFFVNGRLERVVGAEEIAASETAEPALRSRVVEIAPTGAR